MCSRSCTSIWPACSQCVGEPVTSVALPAVVEKVTAAVPAERFVPLCSGRAAVSGCQKVLNSQVLYKISIHATVVS